MKTAMITGFLIALLAVPAGAAEKTLVDEGRLLDGVEGRVRKVDNVDVWQFIPTGAVALDAETTLAAGQALALLPCSVLEQITTLAGEDGSVPGAQHLAQDHGAERGFPRASLSSERDDGSGHVRSSSRLRVRR